MLAGIFRMFTPTRQIESSAGAPSVPASLLPYDADEVKELNRAMSSIMTAVLATQNLSAAKIELRRRISTRQFRAYITVNDDIAIGALAKAEVALRDAVQSAMQIEIADVHWRQSGVQS